MTLPTQPPDSRVPQTPKPGKINFALQKNALNFFGQCQALLASFKIKFSRLNSTDFTAHILI